MSTTRPQDRSRRPDLPMTVAEVHDVAKLLVKGYSAPVIAKELYPAKYESYGRAWAITRVKRVLDRALKTGVIRLGFTRQDLALELQKRFGARIDVVDDDIPEAVHQEAARLIAARIEILIRDRQTQKDPIVIANAGGLALSRVVEYLATFVVPDPQRGRQLLFVSLNALSGADSYQLSANYSAVRMAMVFGGRHLARLVPTSAVPEYDWAMKHIDLLICGAGSREGFLEKWIRHDGSRPANRLLDPVVGDLCLIPLDRQGARVMMPDAIEQRIHRELSPEPKYDSLKWLASQDRVFVVLASTADAMPAKVPIARAILENGLTHSCVLGASLAAALCRSVASRKQL